MNQTIKRLEVRCVFPLLDIIVMKLEANPRVVTIRIFGVEGFCSAEVDPRAVPVP